MTSPATHRPDYSSAFVEAIEALGSGDNTALFALFADNVRWSWMGSLRWTRTFAGRNAVIEELFGGVETTPDHSGVDIRAVISDDTRVVIEFDAHNVLADGQRYDNRYCWIATFLDGRVVHLHEYMDTDLATVTFGPPD